MVAQEAPRLAFIYGSREVLWSRIGGRFFEQNGTIHDALIRCESYVRSPPGWSLQAAFASGNFTKEEVRGPSLTSIQIALTERFRRRDRDHWRGAW